MFDKLDFIVEKYKELSLKVSDPDLHHGKAPSVGRLIIILYRLAICQQSAPIFIFLIFFILGVAFPETVCYYK